MMHDFNTWHESVENLLVHLRNEEDLLLRHDYQKIGEMIPYKKKLLEDYEMGLKAMISEEKRSAFRTLLNTVRVQMESVSKKMALSLHLHTMILNALSQRQREHGVTGYSGQGILMPGVEPSSFKHWDI